MKEKMKLTHNMPRTELKCLPSFCPTISELVIERTLNFGWEWQRLLFRDGGKTSDVCSVVLHLG